MGPRREGQATMLLFVVRSTTLIGKSISHAWAENDDDVSVFRGTVTDEDDEFKIHFEDDEDSVFLTISEIITDALNGDMKML